MRRRKSRALAPRLAPIPHKAAQIVGYVPGSLWRYREHRVALVRQMTSDRVMVKFTADDRIETVLVSALSPWEALTKETLKYRPGLMQD